MTASIPPVVLRSRSVSAFIVVTASLVLSPGVGAQDVSVGEPKFLLSGNKTAPSEPLHLAKGFQPAYPSELRQLDEPGYVVVVQRFTAKGASLASAAYGTHLPLQRAVEEVLPDCKISHPRGDGNTEDVSVWLPIIFNPKSAAVNSPDASPRLLSIVPVSTPSSPDSKESPESPPVVRVQLSLDAAGAIVSLTPERNAPEKLLTVIREKLPLWRFAPARKNGQPVAAVLTISVLCHEMPENRVANFKQGRVLQQTAPIYPHTLLGTGLGGQVTIEFIVDVQGNVVEPVIFESNNPAFDEPALSALLKWKFEPSTRDGKPVRMKIRVPIIFTPEAGPAQGPFQIFGTKDQSKLPPELRFDTPPKIRNVLIPVYPHALRMMGKRGKAKANFLIGGSGRVIKIAIAQADHPEFGRALAAALEGFRFDPALKDGKPVPHILSIEQRFGPNELPDLAGDNLTYLEKKKSPEILSVRDLDGRLEPVSRRPPEFAVSIPPSIEKASALIECLIDRNGRARLPRVIESSDEAFAYAAMQAVSGWWFKPPISKGKPCVVRVQIPFEFGAESPANSPAKIPPP